MSTEYVTYETKYKVLQEKIAGLEKLKELEIAGLEKQKELEIQLAIEKETHDRDVQLEKLKSEKDLQIQKLTIDLAHSNTARLEVMQMLEPRGACEMFEKENVGINFSWSFSKKKEEWIKYSKKDEVKAVLADLGLDDEAVLTSTVESLHRKFNTYVYGTLSTMVRMYAALPVASLINSGIC